MRRLAWLVLSFSASIGCLYEGDARCDAHQVLSAAGFCTCSDGLVLEGSRCVTPAAHDAGSTPASAPTGQGMACTAGGGECDGLEADYCESRLLQQCLVSGCSVGGTDCSAGWTCCAIAAAGTTLCLERARLTQELGSSDCPKL